MRSLRSPVVQFVLLSLAIMAAIIAATGYIAADVAQDEAIDEAIATTGILASSVAAPEIDGKFLAGKASGVDRFARGVGESLQVRDPQVLAVNIWRSDGTLLFANRRGLTRQRFDLDADQRRVLRAGGSGHQRADPDDPVDVQAAKDQTLLRVYTRMTVRQQDLLFEAYYGLDPIDERRDEILRPFRMITVGSMASLLLTVTPILYLLTRRLTRAAEERERLLSSAVDASDAERRRIARDLHDGVVQDIAGTTYSLTAVARDPAVPVPVRQTLDSAGDSLRDSLRALRSLLAEIHPPDLDANGLAPALNDLLAPATNAGIEASVSVDGVDDASDAAVALVWRVAQEAVRNALRHSSASTVAVTVRGLDGRLELEVVDDGTGFDPEATRADRYGLKGLRSLVKDIGGEIEVVSAPGEGTTVRMEVARR